MPNLSVHCKEMKGDSSKEFEFCFKVLSILGSCKPPCMQSPTQTNERAIRCSRYFGEFSTYYSRECVCFFLEHIKGRDELASSERLHIDLSFRFFSYSRLVFVKHSHANTVLLLQRGHQKDVLIDGGARSFVPPGV